MLYLRNLRNQLVLSASVGLASVIQPSFCVANKQYYFNYGSTMIPHPDKKHKGGEDALFVDKQMIVVADGVGGWADVFRLLIKHGIDPGLFSKELCLHIKEIFQKQPQIKLKELITQAVRLTKAIGTSTICTLALRDGQLESALIGDSGYAIYRRNTQNQFELIYKSKEQQKSFNFPYQIGTDGDNPSCALEDKHSYQLGDLIVLGTDGLYDNLSPDQVKIILNEYSKESVDPQLISSKIASYCYKLSLDPKYNSPFAQNAKQQFYRFSGGKSDDITVVVAEIKQ